MVLQVNKSQAIFWDLVILMQRKSKLSELFRSLTSVRQRFSRSSYTMINFKYYRLYHQAVQAVWDQAVGSGRATASKAPSAVSTTRERRARNAALQRRGRLAGGSAAAATAAAKHSMQSGEARSPFLRPAGQLVWYQPRHAPLHCQEPALCPSEQNLYHLGAISVQPRCNLGATSAQSRRNLGAISRHLQADEVHER